MEIKRRIRKSILKKRDEMPKGERAEKSRNIMDKITRMDIYQEAESILCYVNYKSEVETEEFIKETLSRGKKVYCPRIDAKWAKTPLRKGYQHGKMLDDNAGQCL